MTERTPLLAASQVHYTFVAAEINGTPSGKARHLILTFFVYDSVKRFNRLSAMLKKLLDKAQSFKNEVSYIRRRITGMDGQQPRYRNIFATPLFTYTWQDGPEFIALLRERILAHEKESGGVVKSNDGGWHSKPVSEFWATRDSASCTTYIADHATRRVFWRTVNRVHQLDSRNPGRFSRSGFNKVHVHPKSTWSGTYYVDIGGVADSNSGTPLHLLAPNVQMAFFPTVVDDSIYIYPKPGLMVLFPSYVPHMVFPHVGDSPRISIAFNLRSEPFP